MNMSDFSLRSWIEHAMPLLQEYRMYSDLECNGCPRLEEQLPQACQGCDEYWKRVLNTALLNQAVAAGYQPRRLTWDETKLLCEAQGHPMPKEAAK